MPLIATRGAASVQGFGEFAQQTAANYIEEVFSTYLYTSTGGDITITNNIDLSTKGGLVWIKSRSNAFSHYLTDTVRGAGRVLYSDLVNGQSGVGGGGASSFSTTGYVDGNQNAAGVTQVSWTFRKQAKFFDIVTYTGTGANRTIAHNLGSAPGCMIIKKTNAAKDWAVYHRGLGNTKYITLNSTSAQATSSSYWNNTDPTSTVFTVGIDGDVNANGDTYVAYLFAHDAGGFGLTGTDNVISCGSFTTDGSGNATVTLGYEPQWVLTKLSSDVAQWAVNDVMRGMPAANTTQVLYPSLSNAESTSTFYETSPTATGFTTTAYANNPNQTVIYIAIRRGPMKVPMTGTSVYQADYRNATAPGYTSGFPVDLVIDTAKSGDNRRTSSRLQGAVLMQANSTIAETSDSTRKYDYMDGWSTDTGASTDYLSWMFKRAPSFMDVVCYTGTGSTSQTVNHNLGVTPELIIYKRRNAVENWPVAASAVGFTKQSNLNLTDDFYTNYDLTATSSTLLAVAGANTNTGTYVAYLFATCAGVSKVGSYTGNGTTQTIDCGFGAGGARFVLIKRTDSTGNWYVYDTARGMTVLTDPYLFLNSTAAEVATLGSVTTVSTGFALNAAIVAAINTNAASYIFLAIA